MLARAMLLLAVLAVAVVPGTAGNAGEASEASEAGEVVKAVKATDDDPVMTFEGMRGRCCVERAAIRPAQTSDAADSEPTP